MSVRLAEGGVVVRCAKLEAASRSAKRCRLQLSASSVPISSVPVQVIDLSDDKSDDEQAHKQDVISLTDASSPVIHLHGQNNFVSRASNANIGSQPQAQSMPNITSSSGSRPLPMQICPSRPKAPHGLHQTRDQHQLAGRSTSATAAAAIGDSSTCVSQNLPESTAPPLKQARKHCLGSADQPSAAAAQQPPASNACGKEAALAVNQLSQHQTNSLIDSAARSAGATNQSSQRNRQVTPAEDFIDLVKVTEQYSPALQAARTRVQHASSDPALAKALAEKAELERQLREALANKQACHPEQPLRAPMPSHWTQMPQDAPVLYVELPLPPGCRPTTSVSSDQPAPFWIDPAVVQAMTWQGLSKADAAAALRHCNGDGDAAMLYAFECQHKGGAAACVLEASSQAAAGTSDQGFVQATAAEQARREADMQEALQVLARVTEKSTIQLLHIVRIERVQNPHLWTKYCLRRHEVGLAGGGRNVNEQLLFHGCAKDTLAVIGAEGFDIRVSGMSCSLGAGTYFAGNSSYSVGYVDKGPGMTAAPGPGAWGTGALAGTNPYLMGSMVGPGMGNTMGNSMMGNMMGSTMPMPPWAAGPSSAFNNILPHPSRQGMVKSPKQTARRAKQARQDPSKPHFTWDTKAMFLCRVALGRLAVGQPGMRLPPKGSDAVTNSQIHGNITQTLRSSQTIFAVFDNAQAYPEYVIHFKQR